LILQILIFTLEDRRFLLHLVESHAPLAAVFLLARDCVELTSQIIFAFLVLGFDAIDFGLQVLVERFGICNFTFQVSSQAAPFLFRLGELAYVEYTSH
jgi:hypothetical protein